MLFNKYSFCILKMIVKFKTFIVLILIILFNYYCSEPLDIGDKYEYSDKFKTVWHDFDLNYSYFVHRQINWDSLKTVYEPLVEKEITYDFFIYNVLAPMLNELNDLHVRLYHKNGTYIPLYSRPYEKNYEYTEQFFTRYISNINRTTNDKFMWGSISDSLGYVLIRNWTNAEDTEEFLEIFDSNQTEFDNYKGYIIDVRSNGGGSELLAQNVAGRFTSQTEIYAYRKIRNGPDHNDFTDLFWSDISPSGNWQYTKPIIILIGQQCVSSNEAFVLMMTTQDHVTSIGDTTRGSSGNPKIFNLDDGTEYYISSWVAYKTDKTILEDVGIFPDIAIPASQSIVGDQDMVLEQAIEFLE